MMDKSQLDTGSGIYLPGRKERLSVLALLRCWWRGDVHVLPDIPFEVDGDGVVHVTDISDTDVTVNELRDTPRRLISSIEAKPGVFVPFTTDGHTFFIDDGKGPTIELGTAGASVIKLPGDMVMKYGKNTVGDIHFDYAFTFHNDVLLSVQTSVEQPTFAAKDAPTAAKLGGNPKDAMGDAKVDPSLVPPSSKLYLAAAFADGAAKYGPYNWRDNAVRARVYIAAAMRHLDQYLDGENVDPTSKVPHLGHAMACLAILTDATETGNLIDDRPTAGAAGDLIRRYTAEAKFG